MGFVKAKMCGVQDILFTMRHAMTFHLIVCPPETYNARPAGRVGGPSHADTHSARHWKRQKAPTGPVRALSSSGAPKGTWVPVATERHSETFRVFQMTVFTTMHGEGLALWEVAEGLDCGNHRNSTNRQPEWIRLLSP